jgi:hypothetical protein
MERISCWSMLMMWIYWINKNTQTLIDASKEVGLGVNTEKTKYMFLSHHQNVGQNHDIKIGNRCFENVAQFRYLRMMVTNQEEIRRRLNSGNACYHLVQNLLSSHLLSKNIKMRIYKTIIFPVVLYGCDTESSFMAHQPDVGPWPPLSSSFIPLCLELF